MFLVWRHWAVLAHAINSTKESEAGEALSSRLAWSVSSRTDRAIQKNSASKTTTIKQQQQKKKKIIF